MLVRVPACRTHTDTGQKLLFDEVDTGSIGIELDFLDRVFDKSIGKFGIEFRCYDGNPHLCAGEGTRFWWNDGRHAGIGMSGGEGIVN